MYGRLPNSSGLPAPLHPNSKPGGIRPDLPPPPPPTPKAPPKPKVAKKEKPKKEYPPVVLQEEVPPPPVPPTDPEFLAKAAQEKKEKSEKARRRKQEQMREFRETKEQAEAALVELRKAQLPLPPPTNRMWSLPGQGLSQNEHALRWKRGHSRSVRDIAPIPYQEINWDRRNAAKESLKYFCETYMPNVFYMAWSQDQLRCIQKIEDLCQNSGMLSLAMPRASGKTAACRGGLIWSTLFGIKRFPFFIAASQPKATQTLEFIKTYIFMSDLIRQDFPEIAWPVFKIDNRFHLARGQTHQSEPTHIDWSKETVRYPCLIFDEHMVETYQAHDPDSVLWVEHRQVWTHKSAGVIIRTSGIDGSIRGDADVHPITLEQPRPDIVLLDDIQKDQKADSPTVCEKMINLVDGAVSGLYPPGMSPTILMPCTVIREGDVSDTYLDRDKKPEWDSERCRMVLQWPAGVTDYEITDETPEGRLWNQYAEVRRDSYRRHRDLSLATEFYKRNREVMDRGFIVSWEQRYDAKQEESAQQHAMNLRLKNPKMFLSEYQNIGRKLVVEAEITITAEQLMQKTIDVARREIPVECQYVVGFIDVQNEGMYYTCMASDTDFNAVISDFGTYPKVNARYFNKDNLEMWSMLSQEFFKAYPGLRDEAIRNAQGKIRAPFEAKIYHGLSMAVRHVLSLEFTRKGLHERNMRVMRLGIDTRWGQASEVIKRFIRESGIKELVPCYGQAFPPTQRQLEEYERRKGWLFEDQLCPNVKEPKWVFRPNQDGFWYMANDVCRLKDFLFARLSSPKGSKGSMSLFNAPPDELEMFCQQICNSEYPEPLTARGIIKNIWKEREGSAFNNEYLDCAVGCVALLGSLGVSLKTTDTQLTVIRRKWSQVAESKRRKL